MRDSNIPLENEFCGEPNLSSPNKMCDYDIEIWYTNMFNVVS